MNRDVNDLKKWFKNLGLEIDGEIKDDDLKNLLSPKLRDIWRNLFKHVRSKSEVNLIKKVNLLHKLEKHQKPLMAKVDCDADFYIVLKYEELLTKYNKIENDIKDTKILNNKLKSDLIKKHQYKDKLIKDIKISENKCYVAKNKIEYYNSQIGLLNEAYCLCNHFSTNVNEMLTKTDYEDSLINLCIYVDNNKQSDKLYNINAGSDLFNDIYLIISDKSSSVLFQNIEEILKNRINMINNFTETTKSSPNLQDDMKIDNELKIKLIEIQSYQISQLKKSSKEKERVFEKLKYTINSVMNEIVNQHKLKNMSCTDYELKNFEIKLKLDLQLLTNNTISCSNSDNYKPMNDIIDTIFMLYQEKLQEISNISKIYKSPVIDNNYELKLMNLDMYLKKLDEIFLKEINSHYNMSPTISAIKDILYKDIKNIDNFTVKNIPELRVQKIHKIQSYIQIVNFIKEIITKFEQFNNIFSVKDNGFDEISQKEATHIKEFNVIVSTIESNILELDSIIRDTQLITNTTLSRKFEEKVFKN